MCYFLVVGAATEAWRLTALLEEQFHPEVDALVPRAHLSSGFPVGDAVRVAISGGCSCRMFERNATRDLDRDGLRAPAVWPTLSCRWALATLVRGFGTARLCVRSRLVDEEGPLPRATMAVDELLSSITALPTNLLIDLVKERASDPLIETIS
jgi:hypothetical protein